MKASNVFLAIGLVVISGGCYKQSPLETRPPAPATRIVAELTDDGTAAMANALGAGVLGVEGVVTAATDSTWTLQMMSAELRDGRTIDWNREVVRFPAAALADPRVVVFDRKRSWLAGAGITIGAFVVARTFNLIGSPDDDTDPTEPAQSWVPNNRP